MHKSTVLRYPLLIILIMTIAHQLIGQVNRSEIIGAYVYNFAKLSTSPKQEKLDTYGITLISTDDRIIDEFRRMSQEKKIEGKKIKLTVSDDAIFSLQSTCLVFISREMTSLYTTVFKKAKNSEVLIVSDNYPEKRRILLNLYDTDDGSLLFEMNKGNIFERNISINDEVLLLGGTQIDLYEMYLELQVRLNETEDQLKRSQGNLKILNQEIDETTALSKKQRQQIENQALLIGTQKKEQADLIDEINGNEEQITNQTQILSEREHQLSILYDSLITSKQQLDDQTDEIEQGKIVLQNQSVQITKINSDLNSKEVKLKDQGRTIDLQRNLFILFTMVFSIILALVILLYKSQKEKQNRNRQLIESEKMASIGVLSAGVAHEINNPLNFILGGVTGLESMKSQVSIDQAFDIFISSIKTGVERISSIVTGLHQFSQAKSTYDDTCDIHFILDNCLVILNHQLKNKIEIRRSFNDNPINILGNVGKLHQVFMNVILNASQAITDRGHIEINTVIENEYAYITIIDSGEGIEKKNLSRLINPFYTTREPGKGVGLGLSISYSIIQAHHGDIEFQSEVSEGTTVTIKLPINTNDNG